MIRELFEDAYSEINARIIPGAKLEILTWALTVSTRVSTPPAVAVTKRRYRPSALTHRKTHDTESGALVETSIYQRSDLKAGARIDGPAIIVEDDTSTYVAREFRAEILTNGYIALRSVSGKSK